jgi:hypothetical protein
MNLRLELDLNIQIQVQPQAQLLIAALTTTTTFLFLFTTTKQAANSLSCAARHAVDGLASCVLHKVTSLIDAAETSEGPTVFTTLLTAGTALLAAWSALLLLGLAFHFGLTLDVFGGVFVLFFFVVIWGSVLLGSRLLALGVGLVVRGLFFGVGRLRV